MEQNYNVNAMLNNIKLYSMYKMNPPTELCNIITEISNKITKTPTNKLESILYNLHFYNINYVYSLDDISEHHENIFGSKEKANIALKESMLQVLCFNYCIPLTHDLYYDIGNNVAAHYYNAIADGAPNHKKLASDIYYHFNFPSMTDRED